MVCERSELTPDLSLYRASSGQSNPSSVSLSPSCIIHPPQCLSPDRWWPSEESGVNILSHPKKSQQCYSCDFLVTGILIAASHVRNLDYSKCHLINLKMTELVHCICLPFHFVNSWINGLKWLSIRVIWAIFMFHAVDLLVFSVFGVGRSASFILLKIILNSFYCSFFYLSLNKSWFFISIWHNW